MNRAEEYFAKATGQLWLEFCDKKMEAEALRESNEEMAKTLNYVLEALLMEPQGSEDMINRIKVVLLKKELLCPT